MSRLRRRIGTADDADSVKLNIQELIRLSRMSELQDELEKQLLLVNASLGDTGVTPLHVACEVGSSQAIDLLLDLGADMNFKNQSMQTPLDICYSHNHQKTSILLLGRGAEFTYGDVTTSTYSRYHGDMWDTTKNCGRTLLHWAARQGII
jgi:ankyrin repeat protein